MPRNYVWIALVAIALVVDDANAADGPTFTKDVLPILQQHCQDCHRPNQVAPMSLLTYNETRPWAKSIRKQIVERAMPPFHANAPLGHFQNDRRLTEAQIDRMLSWVDGGAVRGRPADAPPPLQWNDDGWAGGEPDLIIEFPEYTTKPINKDETLVAYSDYVFEHPTWVDRFELKSDDYRQVHHVGVYASDANAELPEGFMLDFGTRDFEEDEQFVFPDDPNQNRVAPSSLKLLGEEHLYTWLPGQRQRSTQGRGIEIPKGSRIAVQAHLAPSAVAATNNLTLGIWFANGELKTRIKQRALMQTDLVIPPGAPNYTVIQEGTFKFKMKILGFEAHMHLRGKSVQIKFQFPDGREETVFDLPQYNFDWQQPYWLAEPLFVPPHTTFEVVSAWDNSADNPLNPDPSAEVRWGNRTVDEMLTVVMFSSLDRKQPITVVDGVVVEGL